ncbi:MAG: type II secretion system F family protein [Parvibaculaceae bacterium]|nr:type II secretion system F family protein [Parvibaculaceae bacterium]HBM87941.1 pilus assembly protein [Rhodobiaceae bacterium]|tara:strand:- start:1530 stop:2528 length:999 start_codon:yes stop_codon:yes gene_type:complete
MDQTTIAIFGVAMLVAICVGAVGLLLAGAKGGKSSQRMARVARGNPRKSAVEDKDDLQSDNAGPRRKQVQETLKEIEAKQKAEKEKLTVRLRLQRAGLEITPKTFYIASAVTGLFVAIGMSLSGLPIGAVVLGGFAGGFGVPRWFVNFKTKRRQKAFVEEFANSLDVIVRGVKAGLPINDCLKIIANESPEPVGSEFKELVDGMAMGVTVEQGLLKVYERIPLSEVNFFMIVLAIQAQAGGNLSEALGNLANVLRDRKKMRAKIQAMSQEAKASAGIIGVLPPGVMGLIYLTTPDYISVLFTTTSGNMIIFGSLVWMGMGILVMRKMVNFNF